MKKTMLLMAMLVLTMLSGMTLKAQNLEELVAPGKKVYVEVVDVKESLDFDDEVRDVRKLTTEEMDWVVVDNKADADFVLQLSMWRKKVIGFPRCYMTPAILLPDGTQIWEGKEFKGDANEFNGFRATAGAYWAMVKAFKKEKAFQPAVKDK